MVTVTFTPSTCVVLEACLAAPYPSASPSGELVVEHDRFGRDCLVLVAVPTGMSVDQLFEPVAAEVRSGVLTGLKGIHTESPESGFPTRVAFTPTPGVDLDDLAARLHASFDRARPTVDAEHDRVRAAVATQGVEATLSPDDWWLVERALVDARARRPGYRWMRMVSV